MDETVLLNEALPAAERFAWWCELTERMPAPARFASEHADDFRAGVRCLDFGAVHVATLFYPPLTARRGPAQIRRADPEWYHLLLNLAGSLHYAQCGRQVSAAEGDLVLGDSSHPCEARVTVAAQPARTLVVQLPRAEVRLPGDDPLAALVADHIRQRRLERCRRDLAEPLLSARPVYAIAARWGFAHPAEFSRIFHSAYGIPPGEYRTAALRVRQPTGPSTEPGREVRAPSTPVRSA